MIFNYIILYGDTHGAKVVRLQRNAGVSQTKVTRDLYEWRSFLKSIIQSYNNYLVLELQLKSLPREGTERFASPFLQTSFWKHARRLACARGTYSVAPARKKPSARMRSEGYSQSVCCQSVCCQSVTRHLISRAINRSTNATTYSASDKGRNICGVFSETAAFGSYGVKHERERRLTSSGSACSQCILKAQEVPMKGVYRLPDAIYCSS